MSKQQAQREREQAEAKALLPTAADKRKQAAADKIAAELAGDDKAPKIWVMGRFTAKGIEVLLMGDHNTIEKASAKVNKEAKMRVAFVVDSRAVPAELLAGIGITAAADEDDDEDMEEAS